MLGKSEQSATEPLFTLEEVIRQEKVCQLDHFTQKDVRKMAEITMSICDEYQMNFAVQIYLNGVTVYKYLPEGTGKLHEIWLQKKIETVLMMGGMSTMRIWAMGHEMGQVRKQDFYPSDNIVQCGGGFPIHVKGVGVIGVLAASGPGDQNDHEFCIEAFRRFKGL